MGKGLLHQTFEIRIHKTQDNIGRHLFRAISRIASLFRHDFCLIQSHLEQFAQTKLTSMDKTNWTLNSSIAPSTNRNANEGEFHEAIGSDDATWILTSAFIIFTMQSGFGLLESGMVSRKNEANIMVKNAVDVIYGGLSYWLFGFALSFGMNDRGNAFCGFGYFLTDADESQMGHVFSKYFFQLSFSTTATTIVSGAMAERTNLKAYTMYSFLNTLTYCLPAHWIWDDNGWLRQMGAVDIAGCGAVHLVGGVSGLVATLMLKPRTGRFDPNSPPKYMASPTNVLLGTFMLWWGWLGFNCGSTFGISGMKWKLASRYDCSLFFLGFLSPYKGRSMAEWLEALICNPEAPDSSLLSDHEKYVS